METMEFFIDFILPAVWLWDRISLHKKGEPRVSLGGGVKGGRYVGLTTLPPSCAECIEILGVSTFWNPKSLSRPA